MTSNTNRLDGAMMKDEQILDEFERRAMVLRDTKGTPTLDGVRVIEGVRALLSASNGAATEGFKLLPITPTDDMLRAMCGRPEYFEVGSADRYAAMLAAAPAVPAHCECRACKDGTIHASDCAVHNAPAYPIGVCDCGIGAPAQSAEQWNDEQKEAFADGRAVALKGDDWTQCRFSVRSPLFAAWKQGFESVRKWK